MKNTKQICGLHVKQPVRIVKHHDVPMQLRLLGIKTIDKATIVKQPKISVTIDMQPVKTTSPSWLQESLKNIYGR